jgi:hypothetical protein
MATVHYPKAGHKEGEKLPGEPLPRPYVTLRDGTVMAYKEWFDKGPGRPS